MNKLQIETIKKIVYTFENKANVTDLDALNELINELLSMDSIDRILVSLNDLVKEQLESKLYTMPEEIRCKIQKTLQKIINEGSSNIITILL